MIIRVLQYIAIFGRSIFYYHIYIFLFFFFFFFLKCINDIRRPPFRQICCRWFPSPNCPLPVIGWFKDDGYRFLRSTHPPADQPTTIGVMNCYIPPTPSYSYVCVAHCLSWEPTNPTVADQLSTTQPRTPLMLCTQIVYYQAPRLFLCRYAQ